MENTTTTEALNEEQVDNTVEQSVAATEAIADSEGATSEGEGAVSEGEGTSAESTAEGEDASAESTTELEIAEPIKAEKKSYTRKGRASKAKAKAKSATTSGEDAAPAEVETTTKSKKVLKAEAHVKRCQEIAEEYKRLYPTVTEFHITPDYQVFLGENESAAKIHATKRGGAVQTIKFN